MRFREERIQAATGAIKADLVLKNAQILDVFTQQFRQGDVAISGNEIVGVYDTYEGIEEIDLAGKYIVPGFIDAHRHIESNLSLKIDEIVLQRGTTAIFWDPHELANVKGRLAIEFALKVAERSPLDIIVNLPSCVPATELGTAGARLEIEDLKPFAKHPKVLGLAELMNIGAVLGRVPSVLAKAKAFIYKHIDGHLPGILGKNLNGMLASGVSTDHESTSFEEGLEKLMKGVHVFARAGSAAQNIPALAQLFKPATAGQLGFCTDDRNPLDIANEGDIDHAIRTAIASGADPAAVYTAASYGAAKAFGLIRHHPKFGLKRGGIAPNWLADLVILDDVQTCKIAGVYKSGKLVTDEIFAGRPKLEPQGLNSVQIKETTPDDFKIKTVTPEAREKEVPVIGLISGQIITEFRHAVVPCRDGALQADPANDIVKYVVMERHGIDGSISRGFISGFGFHAGKWALATTVGHDDHNLGIAGTDDACMSAAANYLRECGGGYVAFYDNGNGPEVVSVLELPLFGLMTDAPFEEVVAQFSALLENTKDKLGGRLHDPFQALAFASLSVIPRLKLTNKGLTDFNPAGGDQGPHLLEITY